MKRLCTIGARGGSKGVKNKNIRPLGGLPLIAHSIRQGKACGLFDKVVVSSDSREILDLALAHGADDVVERPPEMATDTAPKLPAIRHCLLEMERRLKTRFDVTVELDPTSPLRLKEDIEGAIALLESHPEAINVITGAPARKSPYFNQVELDEKGLVHLPKKLEKVVHRRQEGPRVYDMNASIYVWWRDPFVANPLVFYDHTLFYEMPELRSCDLDSELDFALIELLYDRGLAERPEP